MREGARACTRVRERARAGGCERRRWRRTADGGRRRTAADGGRGRGGRCERRHVRRRGGGDGSRRDSQRPLASNCPAIHPSTLTPTPTATGTPQACTRLARITKHAQKAIPALASLPRPYAFVPALSSACGASCGRSLPLVFPSSRFFLRPSISISHMVICVSSAGQQCRSFPSVPPSSHTISSHRLIFRFSSVFAFVCLSRQSPSLEERTYRYILATLGRLSVYIHKLRRLQEQETQDIRRPCTMLYSVCCMDIHIL